MPPSIYTYIVNGDLTNIEKLIDNNLGVLEFREGDADYSYTPLMHACWSLKIEVIQLLLKKGADIYAVNVQQRNVLHNVVGNLAVTPVVEHDKIEALWTIAKLLLEHEKQLIRKGCIPATYLLDSKNAMGFSPLEMVAYKPEIHARLLRLINEVKAEFEKRDDSLLFSPPQSPTVEKNGCFSGFFHRRHSDQSEEKHSLIDREPITVGGKPKVE